MKSRNAFALLVLSAASAAAQTNLWQNSGNIGIGTTSPSEKLTISGGDIGMNGGSSQYNWAIHSATDGNWGFGVSNVSSNYYTEAKFYGVGDNARGFRIIDIGQGTIPFWVGGGGNVGIGTTNPSDKLHVVGRIQIDSSATDGFIQTRADNSHIRFGRTDGSIGNLVGYRPDVSPGNFVFYSYSGNWVFTSGNIGIGTTNPGVGTKLQVVGRGLFTGGSFDPGDGTPAGVGVSFDGTCGHIEAVQTGVRSAPLEIQHYGNLGVGTANPTEKLSVNGKIRAKEVIVDTGWSDYVFSKDYHLVSLSEVEQHIKTEKHLPGVPSAQEVAEKGVSVGDMQAILLAKIEELTLHVIRQEKKLTEATAKIEAQQAEIAQFKTGAQ